MRGGCVRPQIVAAIVSISITCGCRRQQAAAPPRQPAVVHNIATPSTEPATQPQASAFIVIDQQAYEFPAARVLFKNKNDQVEAILFSDDPPAAIKDNYSGNSFYLEMTPQLADDGTLNGAVWDYKAPSADRTDNVSGIYLQGSRQHLQPFDVHIVLGGSSSPVPISISGTFLQFDSENDQMPGKFVSVNAQLSASVKAPSHVTVKK
jgi:hypothetical protein